VKVIRDELAEGPDFRVRFRGEVAAARKVSGLFTAPVADAELATNVTGEPIDGGHFFPEERPAAIANALGGFFTR
jgi:hypothetical protein